MARPPPKRPRRDGGAQGRHGFPVGRPMRRGRFRRDPAGKTSLLAVWLWIGLVLLLPFAIVLRSVSRPLNSACRPTARPSTAGNYAALLRDSLYFKAYVGSLRIALISTALTLLLGYPMAYAIARAPQRWRQHSRCSWCSRSGRRSLFVLCLDWTAASHRADQPCAGKPGFSSPNPCGSSTPAAPFISASSTPISRSWCCRCTHGSRARSRLARAAADLGAKPAERVPQTPRCRCPSPGVLAGCLLVFIPAVGES